MNGDVLLVGTTFRALNMAQVTRRQRRGRRASRARARERIQDALPRTAIAPSKRFARSAPFQLEAFLTEVERFEATGKSTRGARGARGPLPRSHDRGGLGTRAARSLLDDAARRAAYKLVWNAQLGADRLPRLALDLDEQRALYTFYLTHPHAPEAQRLAYEAMRRRATTRSDCEKAIAEEHLDMEQWRIDKIRRLGEIDPTYPTGYALGVAYYRAGRYDLSIESFRAWVEHASRRPATRSARAIT